MFDHIITKVMGHTANTKLYKTLKAYNYHQYSPTELVSLDDSQIAALRHKPSAKDAEEPLSTQYFNSLRAFRDFIKYRGAIGQPIPLTFEGWTSITSTEYDEYRISGYFPYQPPPPSALTTVPSGAPTVPSPTVRTLDPVAEFKKGIKRDPSSFMELKHERQWDAFARTLHAMAHAQDVHEVLEPDFTPTHAQIPLFVQKQKYMYAVFVQIIQTDKGKAYVREHRDDHDAQAVFRKLETHALKSLKASLESTTLLRYLTTTKLGVDTWKGTAHSFILHWLEQVRLYNDLSSTTDLSDELTLTLLQNAVHDFKPLRAVKDNADQHKTHTGNELTLEQYVNLLESAAINHDASVAPKRSVLTKRRQVLMHDLDYDFTDDFIDDDIPDFDIDAPLDVLQAYAASRRPPTSSTHRSKSSSASSDNKYGSTIRQRLHPLQWAKLSDNGRKVWDQLTVEDKRVILNTPRPTFAPRSANLHDLGPDGGAIDDNAVEADPYDTSPSGDDADVFEDAQDIPDGALYSAYQSALKNAHPADMRKMLSSTGKPPSRASSQPPLKQSPPPQSGNRDDERMIDGKLWRQVKCHVTYSISNHSTISQDSLVDRGANGGIAGDDVRVIEKVPDRFVNVRGIDNHEITEIPIVTAGGVTRTQHGEVIVIMHQYAWHGKGRTIHSSGQLEHFQNKVDDRSYKVGGYQRIKTLDGYTIPLDIKSGLPYMKLRPYTDDEWDALPHVLLTSDDEWDPTVLDHAHADDDDIWFDALSEHQNDIADTLFDEQGNYLMRRASSSYFYDARTQHDIDDVLDACVCAAHPPVDFGSPDPTHTTYVVFDHTVTRAPPDYSSLRKFFGWLPTDIIKKTFEHTTQYARTPISTILNKHYKAQFPAFNVRRRNESVATDTIFSDTPAIDDGSTMAQLFVGTETLVTDAYGIKFEKQFVNTLEDNIRQRGAMNKLVSDRAQVEISNRVQNLLRALIITSWQSEAYQQNQNPCERRWKTVKRMTNTLLDRSGSPAYTWLLCLLYVCFLLNHAFNASLNAVPMQLLTGSTPDISPLIRFYWWQPVYYRVDDSDFPSESREGRGRWVGVAEHVGHHMTFKILTDDTRKIIFRSNIRPADSGEPNYRLDLLCGEDDDKISKVEKPILKSRLDKFAEENKVDPDSIANHPSFQMEVVNPTDLVGRSFMLPTGDDGQRFRAHIVEAIGKFNDDLNASPEHVKFRCSINDDQYEELLTYRQIMDYIEKDADDPVYWKFKRIIAHEGPLHQEHPSYNGSKWNVMVEWENGEVTSEPLTIIANDDPASCAQYALNNDLLYTEGWRQFRRLAKNMKKLTRQINQAKLCSYRTAPTYKYGFEVPKNYDHACRLDDKFGTSRWKEAVIKELGQLDEYEVFDDLGHKNSDYDKSKLKGYKWIRTHLVFDVKHDGRHKARMVADGHLTDIPLSSVYSGVVSLRGLRLMIFLAELNELETWATDIGNAYLEANTSEKVYIIAGPEFGKLEGHVLIIRKALYGLRTSGVRWHERLADCLRSMGFAPSWSEPDIWMRRAGDVYEYVAVYVDDLAIAAKNPQEIIDTLVNVHKFKLKGTGNIQFHLGMDFYRDDDNILCIAPIKYIKKMIMSYEQMFGKTPRTTAWSPLEKGDHPELDDSEFLNPEDTQKYQSLIGALQWAISIGRLDITTAIMTMSSFRTSPRKGHLERLKRIYGYLAKFNDMALRIRVNEPDFSQLQEPICDWTYSVYGEGKELIPHEMPEPLGNAVTLSHYVDANLYHDMLTGKAVTGVLHFINQTPIDWFSKKQSTVETATYGSEFVAARTCTEQILELRHTLRYLGVPIRDKSYMFGDNESVVNSSMHPHAKLHKRHTMLSFHRVRQAIAHHILVFFHIDGKINPADLLSKHWGYSDVWECMLKPLMHWKGDTAELLKTDG